MDRVLTTSWFNPPSKIPFNAVILIEPPIFPKEMYALHETPVYKAISSMTPLRRENWASREAAQAWMAKRLPWSMWDPEALEIYVVSSLLCWPLPSCSCPRNMAFASFQRCSIRTNKASLSPATEKTKQEHMPQAATNSVPSGS